jgi:hypothetical protein
MMRTSEPTHCGNWRFGGMALQPDIGEPLDKVGHGRDA